ncbi:hypothetical protein D3C81_1104210 [compost metagenome]
MPGSASVRFNVGIGNKPAAVPRLMLMCQYRSPSSSVSVTLSTAVAVTPSLETVLSMVISPLLPTSPTGVATRLPPASLQSLPALLSAGYGRLAVGTPSRSSAVVPVQALSFNVTGAALGNMSAIVVSKVTPSVSLRRKMLNVLGSEAKAGPTATLGPVVLHTTIFVWLGDGAWASC